MRKTAVLLAFLFALASSAAAADVSLTSVAYPEGTSVGLKLVPTQAAPDARVDASVRYKDGQAAVEVFYKRLEPALLFGGDVSAYVVWAVSPDGNAENIGEIGGTDTSGSNRFQTHKKDFALMVTAEPLAAVPRSSSLVVFTSSGPDTKSARATAITFSGFVERPEVKVEQKSIAGLSYSGKEPVVVVQARRAVALAERVGAGDVKPDLLAQAKTAVAQANNSLTGSGGSTRAGIDASRKAVELSWQAIAAAYEKKDAAVLAQAAARRAAAEAKTEADKAAAEQKAKELQQSVATTSAALGESEAKRREAEAAIAAAAAERARLSAELAQAASERQALAAEKATIEGQRNALLAQLNTALGRMATSTKSERGQVVSLAGTAFPSGRATLTTDAKYTLAKLAGVLMAAPDVNLSIEGHTDSTGVAAKNDKLSADRAAAVKTFLAESGVEPGRMKSAGYGSRIPIAPNDTAEGRAKNRRVDIVLATGDIAAPAAVAEAPPPVK